MFKPGDRGILAIQQIAQPSLKKRPHLYYGYVIVFVSLVVMTLTFGVNYSYGVFFTPLSGEFGWGKAATSAGYSLLTIFAGFLGIFAGRLSDKVGIRAIAISGAILLSLGSFLMYYVNAIWQFYLIFALLLGGGVGGCWPSLMAAIPRWFVRHRGLMTGIVGAGTGLGSVTLPPLISAIIPTYGWRVSFVIMGAIVLVLIVTAAMFMKREPRQTGQSTNGAPKTGYTSQPVRKQGLSFREMISDNNFWLVCMIYFFFGFGLHTIMVHIVPHAIEMGISPESAAGVLATVGGISTVSRLIVGSASDRLGIRLSLAINFILMIAALLWLQYTSQLWMLYLFAIVFGIAYGGVMTMQSLVLAELFGLGSLGLIVGGVSFIYTAGSALGPLVSGYIFDITQSYRLAFLICTIFAVVALTLVLTAIRKKQRMTE